MALSDSRSPILDYAAANAIPTYVPPTVIPEPKNIWITENTGQDIVTEDNKFNIQWDASPSGDTV